MDAEADITLLNSPACAKDRQWEIPSSKAMGQTGGSSTGAGTACRIFPISALLIGNRLDFAFQAL